VRREGRAKIWAVVVDDEPLARSSLKLLLRRDAEVELVGECKSGMEALAEIRRKKPELVFLDVQMPECDGFDVLEQLGSEMPPALVFVTAYDQYALRAFEAEKSSGWQSKTRDKSCSRKSPKSIGLKPRTTTCACMWERKHTCCAGAWRMWIKN